MRFEKVHTIRHFYDDVRSGTADFGGVPHFFACIFDDALDEWSDRFLLYPVTVEFMEHELNQWTIYRTWEEKFRSGRVSSETHPAYGGIDPQFDQLSDWLDCRIKLLTPLAIPMTAVFRSLPGQEDLPRSLVRELEVAWSASVVAEVG